MYNNKIFIIAIASLTASNYPCVDALPPGVGRRDRRLYAEADMGDCAGELYNLSLIVDKPHVSLIAKPAESENCPWILYEASALHSEMHLEKHSYSIDSNQDIEGLQLGSFTFTTLHDAFENALIDTSSPYHVVSNNCGSLAVKMAGILDIDPTDPKFVAYTAEKLSSGAADLNVSPADMKMIMDAMDAYGAVEDLISASIQEQL